MRTLFVASVCVAVASCGGSSSSTRAPSGATTATTAPAVGDVVRVEMKDIHFRPERIVVRIGQSVRWTNRDSVAHTVAAQAPAFASDAIASGQTYTYRPRRKGIIHYFCTIHANQNGVLVVQ